MRCTCVPEILSSLHSKANITGIFIHSPVTQSKIKCNLFVKNLEIFFFQFNREVPLNQINMTLPSWAFSSTKLYSDLYGFKCSLICSASLWMAQKDDPLPLYTVLSSVIEGNLLIHLGKRHLGGLGQHMDLSALIPHS